MRIILIAVIQIFSTLIYSQIPNGYYNGMDTLVGNSLKVGLHTLLTIILNFHIHPRQLTYGIY